MVVVNVRDVTHSNVKSATADCDKIISKYYMTASVFDVDES